MLSLIGTWSHELARAYLALEIGGTTAALGSLLLSAAVPSLFLTLHGGLWADRKDARKIILFTKALLALASLSLFFLVEFTQISLFTLYLFAFIEGVLNSYDSPAYTATFQRLIPKSEFKMAVTLQSTSFHLCRMMGPAIAGMIMKFGDTAYVFLFDAVTYLAVIYALRIVKLRDIDRAPTTATHKNFSELMDGFRYFFGTPSLRYKVLQFLLSLSLMMPVSTVVFRSFLKVKFGLDGGGFGVLFSFPALGSMVGALIFIIANFDEPLKNLRFAVPGLVGTLLLMNFAPSLGTASALLALVGLFTYMTVNSVTQSMHFEILDRYRGRLGSIIAIGFTSISALMSFPIAYYADHYGFERAIRDPVIIYSICSFGLAVLHGKLPMIRKHRPAEIAATTDDSPLI